MADQPMSGTYRFENAEQIADASGFGIGRLMGKSADRSLYVDTISGAGAGTFASSITPPSGTRIVVLGFSLQLPVGSPAASVLSLQVMQAGNALLSIPDSVVFADMLTVTAPSSFGVPFATSAYTPCGAQLVSRPGNGGIALYRVVSTLPAGIAFDASVYIQAIQSGDVPTPC